MTRHNKAILLDKATQLAQRLAAKVHEASNQYLVKNPISTGTICQFLGSIQSIVNELGHKRLIIKINSMVSYEDFDFYLHRYHNANLVISPLVDNYYTVGVGIGFNQAIHHILFSIEIHTFDLLTKEDKQNMYLISNNRKLDECR